jgi:NAD(P)-dependent dehydrogenase (short-subunit alcohol dehydrogenase family)
MPKPSHFHGRLQGRVVLVTGAGSAGSGAGTGSAIAHLFALEGARVALIDRERARAEHTLAMIAEGGGSAHVLEGDITNAATCEGLVAAAAERFGGLDILVNNVGVASGTRLEDQGEADWHRILNVNLTGAMLMTRSALPHLKQHRRGCIVNIASLAGLVAVGGSVAYGASKAGLIQLTRDVALQYGPEGIRANVIVPGHIFTPMTDGMFDEAARELRRKIAPLGLVGDAWDVAQAALFLASDEARFVSGACLPVDGGVSVIGALAGTGLANR